MYQEHSDFNPPNADATLWRYMDFMRFVSLLDSRSLFFARADKLGDPFEGATTSLNAAVRPLELGALNEEVDDENISLLLEMFSRAAESSRSYTLVNCWHQSDHESAAMWKLYSREHDGIAVKTDFRSLAGSFTCSEAVFIGRVEYIDYDKAYIQKGDILKPYLYKRQSFEHEREVRAITLGEFELVKRGEFGVAQGLYANGAYRAMDISQLIREVIVAPYADSWFTRLVQSVASRYELTAPVTKSRLSETPTWD